MLQVIINYRRLMAEATLDAIFARRPFCLLCMQYEFEKRLKEND